MDLKGRVILITNNDSVFTEFLGRYGVVIDKAYDNKWTVEFNARVKGMGALHHTVAESDFVVIGIKYDAI